MKKYILIIGLLVTSLAFSQGGYTRPAQGIGTLQQVTDLGNNTTNSITANGLHSTGQLAVGISLGNAANFYFSENTASFNTGMILEQTGSGDVRFHFDLVGGAQYSIGIDNSDSEKFKISSSGTLGTSDVMVIDASLNTVFSANVTANDFIGSSDRRLKDSIKLLNTIIDIDYKEFYFKSRPNRKRYGVIAQELEINNPELVHTNDKGFKSVSYIDLHSIEISNLKKQMNHLQEENKLQNIVIVMLILSCIILGVLQAIQILKRK